MGYATHPPFKLVPVPAAETGMAYAWLGRVRWWVVCCVRRRDLQGIWTYLSRPPSNQTWRGTALVVM
jgi:hypothetical protein